MTNEPTDDDAKRDAPPTEKSDDDAPDPAFTGMPSKAGGGKETEKEQMKDHD